MIRLTLNTVSRSTHVVFPAKANLLHYPDIYGMGEKEVKEEIKKFLDANPTLLLVSFHKDVLRGNAEQLEIDRMKGDKC